MILKMHTEYFMHKQIQNILSGGVLTFFNFSFVINIFHRGPYKPPSKVCVCVCVCVWGGGGGSIPVFLRKPLATCYFPGEIQTPCPPSSRSANVYESFRLYEHLISSDSVSLVMWFHHLYDKQY